ncbi:MAG: T9SS type A sorting domain-containing protein [Bacteroidota bacterium]
MTTLIRSFCALAILLLALHGMAQESISLPGDDVPDSAGSSGYPLGLVFEQAGVSPDRSVSQNVQQAFAILPTTSVEIANISLALSISPNPTAQSLQLKMDATKERNYYYRLMNFQGQTLEQGDLEPGTVSLDLSLYSAGMYLLQVRQSHLPIHTFTIIKQ